jgi:hypothetical protein
MQLNLLKAKLEGNKGQKKGLRLSKERIVFKKSDLNISSDCKSSLSNMPKAPFNFRQSSPLVAKPDAKNDRNS